MKTLLQITNHNVNHKIVFYIKTTLFKMLRQSINVPVNLCEKRVACFFKRVIFMVVINTKCLICQ